MNDAFVFALPPGKMFALYGSGFATLKCFWVMKASSWQMLHSRSVVIGRFSGPWPWPVSKFTLSWHAPHVLRFGRVFQLSALGALLWHLVQLRTSCGKLNSF